MLASKTSSCISAGTGVTFQGRSTLYSDKLNDFSVTIPICYKDVYVNSFFPCTATLWKIECFPLTCDLSGLSLGLTDISDCSVLHGVNPN